MAANNGSKNTGLDVNPRVHQRLNRFITMNYKTVERPYSLLAMAITGLLFGLLTIKSGGAVLFVEGIDREQAGNYVPLVVWFNFFAGFTYIIAGAGLFWKKKWAVWLAITIAIMTLLIFAIFGVYVFNGGIYEIRTVIAMSFRCSVWFMIGIFSYRQLI